MRIRFSRPSNPYRLLIWLVPVTVVSGMLVYSVFLSNGDDGLRLRPSPSVAIAHAQQLVGDCLAPDLPEAAAAGLANRAKAAGGADPYSETITASIDVTPDEARSLLAFEAKIPTQPQGWTAATRLRDDSPVQPLARCALETVLVDPAVSETVTYPGFTASGESHGSDEPIVIPEETVTIEKSVLVAATPALEELKIFTPDGDGLKNEWTEVQGLTALVVTRDYDEPSVVVYWHDNEVAVSVSCSLVTKEECLQIAETVK